MPFVLQHTLAAPADFSGVGVHTGETVSMRILPAPADFGVAFRRADLDGEESVIRACALGVCATRLGTVIGNAAGVTVATVEHVMAALSALGVDNAQIEIDCPEAPILDGSAAPFVRGIDRAGRRPQRRGRRFIEILAPTVVTDGEKRAALTPCADFEVAFEIAFPSAAIGRQRIDLAVDEARFRSELADCRTFGFKREVEALRAAGLARGGSLENAIVVDGDGVLNPEGLRRKDEFVRHKALDAIGDLYLAGAPILGRYEGRYAGHALNNALVRALLANPSRWRFTLRQDALAQAS